VLEQAGIANAQVQDFGAPGEFLISVESKAGQAMDEANIIKSAIANGLPGTTMELRREEAVGPKVGAELRTSAANSVFASLVLIIIYVGIRFVFRYGVAGVIALAHDVTITLGIFSVLNKEISLSVIAAFLTIVGYSIMDSVVVFDRIRENMRLRRREGYPEVINVSINQTLSRTVLTSGCTLLTTASLWILGGPVIRDFAFALTFGIVVGTYSSIFIAAPILVWWVQRRVTDKRRPQPAM
jgi:preprotein translocase SecF subunit